MTDIFGIKKDILFVINAAKLGYIGFNLIIMIFMRINIK